MINIGIVEDDDFVRNELVSILKQSSIFDPILSSESAENFLKHCEGHNKIRFVLMDIGLPGISGIEAIPKLKKKLPNTEVVILSSFKDSDSIFKALRAGASGYILKDSGLEQIENTLSNIDQGVPALSPAIARRIISFFNVKRINIKEIQLTEKETNVLRFLVDGLSYKLIADNMGFTINTTRYHVKNIYKKLHINSRPELVKMYLDGDIKFET
ncbi:MAG: response regulator [Saprospiraceae bacterium]